MNEAVFKQMENVSHLQAGLSYPAPDGKSRRMAQKIHYVSEVMLHMIQAASEVLGMVLAPPYKRDAKLESLVLNCLEAEHTGYGTLVCATWIREGKEDPFLVLFSTVWL